MASRKPKPEGDKAKTEYQEHMAKYESKAEKKEADKKAKKEVDKLSTHPKFDKFK